MSNAPKAIEFKALLALTAVVLLVHLALLQGSAVSVDRKPPLPAPAFTTFTVDLTPPRQIAAPETAKTAVITPSNLAPTLPPRAPNLDPGQAAPLSNTDQPTGAPGTPHDPVFSVTSYTVPDSVRIKYQVEANKFPYRLNAVLLWKHSGQAYEARLELSAFGQTRSQTSRGQITPQGLSPRRFSDKYRSEVAAHFNHEQGKVTFSANTPDVPLQAGAQDRLSILVQLAAMIAGAPGSYPANTIIATQTIGPRDADNWLFSVGNSEILALPGGEQPSLKLVRNPRRAFDQKVELWLAPALGYLPVRIRITESNGDFIDQKWLATESHN